MKWYLKTGPDGDVVISTRVRLARNITDYPFPSKMSPEQYQKVEQIARDALMESRIQPKHDFEYIDMARLTPAHAMSFAEKHLISPEFARERDGRALLLNKDETLSVMINEEDHIRIQALFAGMQLEDAFALADEIDDVFDEKLRFAFDENLGYLTQCPTNLGTGLRASVMLHLPAITKAGAMPGLANAVGKFGLTIRGTFGEGTAAKGAFYQISNQVTLGISEKEAISNLSGIAGQIITQEKAAREQLRYLPELEDKVFRSYGLLTNARLLSADEFMSLISDVRLGITLGIIKNKGLEVVNALLCDAQPATLMTTAGRNLDASARDQLRAQTVREKLA
jgi:protein arginine kinase